MGIEYGDKHQYDDIINLPHHVSKKHPQMSPMERAAQFMPFQALTGYGNAIKETARLTDEKTELDENSKAELDARLQMIKEKLAGSPPGMGPETEITYFQPDEKKAGGAYVTVKGRVKKIDEYEGKVVLVSGEKINIEEIVGIE